jgi:hypothetical protein
MADNKTLRRLRRLAAKSGLRIASKAGCYALFDKGASLNGPLNPHPLTLRDLENTLKDWEVLHTVFWTEGGGMVMHESKMEVDFDRLEEEWKKEHPHG